MDGRWERDPPAPLPVAMVGSGPWPPSRNEVDGRPSARAEALPGWAGTGRSAASVDGVSVRVTGASVRAPSKAVDSEEAAGLAQWSDAPVPELEPTAHELQTSARILLYLDRLPRIPPGETAPDSLTQAGMAQALGTTQPAISNVLRRLVAGGALEVERAHVVGRVARVKVYRLSRLGEQLAGRIRASLVRR